MLKRDLNHHVNSVTDYSRDRLVTRVTYDGPSGVSADSYGGEGPDVDPVPEPAAGQPHVVPAVRLRANQHTPDGYRNVGVARCTCGERRCLR